MMEVALRDLAADFDRVKAAVRHEPVAIRDEGGVTGYFVSVQEYERLRRRNPVAPAQTDEEFMDALRSSRMHPEDDPEGLTAAPDPVLDAIIARAR